MAELQMQRTCWRGLQLDHPAQWELSAIMGSEPDGRLSFADRRYTRLEVSWRRLSYVPKLERMLDKYRQRTGRDDGVTLSPLEGAGADWQGVVRTSKEGISVHGGRFFRPQRLLAEVTIVWPRKRRGDVERMILASVTPESPDAPVRNWRAWGLDLCLEREMDLVTCDPKVGQVSWTFAQASRKRPVQLTVERTAMAEHWLQQPLGDWLVKQLPPRSRVLEKSEITFNSHPAQRLLSRRRIGTLARLLGRRQVRLDIAWRCPADQRVYHLACTQTRRQKDLELPPSLVVRCCVPAPVVAPMAEL